MSNVPNLDANYITFDEALNTVIFCNSYVDILNFSIIHVI